MVDTISAAEQPVSDSQIVDSDQYGSTTAARQHAVHAVCTVERPMNSHGALTLRTKAGHRTFHVVEYATPETRTALARTPATADVRVQLVPLSARGDTWRAVGITAIL